MKITIESTGDMTTLDGRQCRIWRGVTERGTACVLAVALVRVDEDADRTQFEEELRAVPPPTRAIDLRFIL